MPSFSKSSHLIQPISEHTFEARTALRRQLRAQRKALSADAQIKAGQSVLRQLTAYLPQQSALTIATYLANDGEVDLSHYIANSWQKGLPLSFALPVLHPVCKGHLLFLRYQSDTDMVINKYGIKEPALSCLNVIPTPALDVILMPLVGFDQHGNRLGMGGGYYDRTLAFTHSATHKPKLIGIAHDLQEVASLPVASWDVPLDAIITPTRVLQF
ncbi:5-formyltetrahydrofolate cyclo-ligase [Alteromonas sp. D210916BOD_24]|uniref:5-formyltetrahydrofolate cyclo-ligase n=1 Tax=Alteromonas sp. D210916BOD_24 TaxID=3157618 RepID=UPI00399D465F